MNVVVADNRDQIDNGQIGEALAALADLTRRQLLDQIAAAGGATATRLAGGMPITRQAVVKHLSVLTQAGLVTAQRQGREVRYAVQPSRLRQVEQWAARAAEQWESRLDAIKHIAERE